MLNKKSAFKPKAAVRRPAPASAPRASQRPPTTERSSDSTPAPQESSSSQPQPAPQSGPSAALEKDRPASGEKDVSTPLQAQDKQKEQAVPRPAPQDSIAPTEGTDGRAATTPPTEVPGSGPAGAQPQQIAAHGDPEIQEPSVAEAPVVDTGTRRGAEDRPKAVSGPSSAATSTEKTAAPTETRTTTEAPNAPPTPPPAPVPVPVHTASATQADQPTRDEPAPITPAPIENAESEPHQSTTDAEPQPAEDGPQAAKPKRARKRTTPATSAEDSGEQSAAPPKKRPRKRAAPLPGEEGYQPAASRPARSRKRRASAADNENAEGNGEGDDGQPRKRPPRAQRQATPPDAEHVEIDITQVKMAELAKDMHIGKKFSLHDELMERERAKRLRYNERRRRQQAGEEGEEDTAAAGEAAASASSDPNTGTRATPQAADTAGAETPAEEESNPNGPIGETYQIINGQIVLDHRSLQVDRHARAREEAGQLVEVEENDFTHHTTTATYLRRNLKPQQWTDDETELFYSALQAFGTDFDTICRMFKGKTRKHIKLKFNREERVNPQRINAALVGQKTVPIDMDHYQRATGREYETAEAIYAEQRRAEEEFEAKQKALEDEKADEVRRRKEEVLAQLNSAVGDGQDGDSGRKGRRGRKKKAPAVVGL